VIDMPEPTTAPRSAPWAVGCIIALGLGFLTVGLFFGALILFAGSAPSIPPEEWPFFLFQVLLAAAPFGLLALLGVRSRLPWVIAAVLTICFWTAYFASVLISARDRTGANIGMGLIMFVSPFIIGGIALGVARLTTTD